MSRQAGASGSGGGIKQQFANGSRYHKTNTERTCSMVGTMDGSLGVLVPLSDNRIYHRLYVLQHYLTLTLESTCALNFKDFRSIKTKNFRVEKKKGILDGAVLWSYVNLDAARQEELAKLLGTSVDSILENLQDIDNMTQFF